MTRFRLRSPHIKLVENDVEKACADFLSLRGYRLERLHAGRFKTLDGRRYITGAEPGTPDFLAVHGRHRAFYLETKAPRGVLSPAQRWMHQILTRGYRLQVATIDDVSELADWLRKHEEPTKF
jgi:hypothetical protein